VGNNELIEVDVEYLAQTSKALLIDNDKEGIWLPKSQIKDSDGNFFNFLDLKEHEYITILLPEWLAMDKGLI
jgi:hypothetical protein